MLNWSIIVGSVMSKQDKSIFAILKSIKKWCAVNFKSTREITTHLTYKQCIITLVKSVQYSKRYSYIYPV